MRGVEILLHSSMSRLTHKQTHFDWHIPRKIASGLTDHFDLTRKVGDSAASPDAGHHEAGLSEPLMGTIVDAEDVV